MTWRIKYYLLQIKTIQSEIYKIGKNQFARTQKKFEIEISASYTNRENPIDFCAHKILLLIQETLKV